MLMQIKSSTIRVAIMLAQRLVTVLAMNAITTIVEIPLARHRRLAMVGTTTINVAIGLVRLPDTDMEQLNELRKRIDDLYGALLMERISKCPSCQNHAAAVVKKNGSQSMTREASSCSIAVVAAIKRKQQSIARKS